MVDRFNAQDPQRNRELQPGETRNSFGDISHNTSSALQRGTDGSLSSNHAAYNDPRGLRAAAPVQQGAPKVAGRNNLKLGWDTQEEFEADPIVQMGLGGVGSIKSVVSNGAAAVGRGAQGLWQGAKKLVAGGDDAAKASAPNSVKAGYSRDAAGVITQNPVLASALRTAVNKHPILAGGAALAAGVPAYKSVLNSGDDPAPQQAPVTDPQATAQATAQVEQKQQLLQAARVKLGLSPHEGGDVYSPDERAAITQAQGEWLGRNGISAEDQAQPAQSHQQASMNSRQTGGKNGLEAGKNYKLQYGPNTQMYGKSDRADGMLNNFTGIGDGTDWKDRPENRQNYRDAVARFENEKKSLTDSIMARAGSGDKADYDFAMNQASGLGLREAVQEASRKGEAWRRDPAGVYKQQLESTGKAEDRRAALQMAHQDRVAALDVQKAAAAGAAQQRADVRGDKTFEKVDERLKSLAMEDGKLNGEKYNKLRTYIEQSLAARNQSLESAGPEMLDELLFSAEKSGVKGRFNTLRSLIGKGDKEVPAHQYGMFKDRKSGWLGDELQRTNGDWVPASEIEGGGIGPFSEPVDPRGRDFVKRNLQFHRGGA